MTQVLSEKAKKFLEERRYAILGTINADGTPHLSAMWYLLEGDTIMMNTKAGRVKERNMRRDPRISICLEDGERYLTIAGTVEFIDDPETVQGDIYRLAVRYDGEESAKRLMQEAFSKQDRITIRMKCERVIERF